MHACIAKAMAHGLRRPRLSGRMTEYPEFTSLSSPRLRLGPCGAWYDGCSGGSAHGGTLKTKVSDWMTRNPITIDADATVVDAIRLLKQKKIRRLPVMRSGKLVGLVTEKMLLDYSPSKATTLDVWEMNALLSMKPISEVMNPEPHTVTPDTELTECARIIHDRKLNGIAVLDQEGNLVGIFTTTDALNALAWFSQQMRDAQR